MPPGGNSLRGTVATVAFEVGLSGRSAVREDALPPVCRRRSADNLETALADLVAERGRQACLPEPPRYHTNCARTASETPNAVLIFEGDWEID
jgi:hypothetical protein